MKGNRIAFTIALVTLVIGFVLIDRGRDDTILRLTQSLADTDWTAAVRDTRPDNSRAQRMKGPRAGSRLTAQEVRHLLSTHNAARAEVGASPLVWSDSLALYAQEWADHLASTTIRLEHRPHSGRWKQKHGENLFMGTAGYYGVADAVAAWENEKYAYHGQAIDMSNFYAFGHYTQLIWKNTKSLGCARAENGGNMIVVCNYDPAGNIVGHTPY
ncbi:MAG: CAP domain-containing protein [Syntrophorhabdaceae bacterium]|nr:CAP domain-containing protein [Syntrophorhabdaceae bacterium]MDD4194980.1 CAP domain-containing protein [Syntrophorhabdaceae bacterium]